MRLPLKGTCSFFLLFFFIMGCIGPAKVVHTKRMTLLEVEKKDHLIQNVAAILSNTPQTEAGRQLGEHFFQNLLETLRHEDRRLHLITESRETALDFLQAFKRRDLHVNVDAVADVARRKGYQGFLVAQVMDIRTKVEESGLLWWRKPRHYLTVAVAVDVYDPFTDAKMTSRVEEKTVKLSASDYDRFQLGEGLSVKKIAKMMAGLADDIGTSAAETIAAQPWKTTILEADAGEAVLAAGGRSGLEVGDRLDVFKDRSLMKGLAGREFRVPGYKAGQLRIVAVEGRFMRAAVEGQADIGRGDLAVAVN